MADSITLSKAYQNPLAKGKNAGWWKVHLSARKTIQDKIRGIVIDWYQETHQSQTAPERVKSCLSKSEIRMLGGDDEVNAVIDSVLMNDCLRLKSM